MNEQAQEALAVILQRAISGVDQAVEFSKDQLPKVAEQVLHWKMLESLIHCIPSLMIWSFIAFFLFKLYKKDGMIERWKEEDLKCRPSDKSESFCKAMSWMVIAFLFAISLIAVDFDWLKIAVAPKLFLLEYSAELINGTSMKPST